MNNNFDVNYTSTTGVTPYKGINNDWYITGYLGLKFNSSSKFGASMLNNNTSFSNSAILDSLSVNASGFVIQGIGMFNSFYKLPAPLTPINSFQIAFTFLLSTRYYEGPLDFSLNVTSPSKNIVVFSPAFSVQEASNQRAHINFQGFGTSGLGYYNEVNLADGNVSLDPTLNSSSNFTISRVTVSYPFTLSNVSYGFAHQPYLWNSNFTSYTRGNYSLDLWLEINMPAHGFDGQMNITIFTKNS